MELKPQALLARLIQVAHGLKRRSWPLLLCAAAAALVSAASVPLPGVSTKPVWLSWTLYVLAAACMVVAVVILVRRIPPFDPKAPASSLVNAAKGPAPFTEGDAELFAQLGRARLLAL